MREEDFQFRGEMLDSPNDRSFLCLRDNRPWLIAFAIQRRDQLQRKRCGRFLADQRFRSLIVDVANPDDNGAMARDGGTPGVAMAATGARLPCDEGAGRFGANGARAVDAADGAQGLPASGCVKTPPILL